jgi:hypothetical protein
MFCSISGQAPERAVVSKLTGHVYEASLLEKYLVAEGKVRGGNPAAPAASAPPARAAPARAPVFALCAFPAQCLGVSPDYQADFSTRVTRVAHRSARSPARR